MGRDRRSKNIITRLKVLKVRDIRGYYFPDGFSGANIGTHIHERWLQSQATSWNIETAYLSLKNNYPLT